MGTQRLDLQVVARGLADSREKAQRLIRAGAVRVDGAVSSKPGNPVREDAVITVDQPERFVSRGGEKLEEAFRKFPIRVEKLVCVDIGASTGGFTDCMLQHGAAKVYALDVGHDQLHWRLRNDPRVISIEGVNARHLRAGFLPELADFGCADVSFISLDKILAPLRALVRPGSSLVTLIKPQFEAGPELVESGGVVRDPAVRAAVAEKIRAFGEREAGLVWKDMCASPLPGPAGNVEFLAWWIAP